MPTWLTAFLAIAGGLFALKMVYAASIAVALPTTMGAIYVSTPRRRIEAAVDALRWEARWLVYDLGCGDGRVLRAVRKRAPVRAVGFEVNTVAWARAKLLCFRQRIVIRRESFWNVSVKDADVIFCYLFPDVMERLSQKLRQEAKAGARVVSFNFPLAGFQTERILRPQGSRHGDPVYIYRM